MKLVIFTSIFSFATPIFAFQEPDKYPKLANYYLDWDLTDQKVNDLAKWDLITLSAGAYTRHPDLVKKLRSLNPKQILLVYVVANEVNNIAPTLEEGNHWKEIYQKVMQNDWWLYTDSHQRVSTWPNTDWINLSSGGKIINGQQYSDWLADSVNTKFLNDPQVDGVFYDNIFSDLSWVNRPIDIDGDGIADPLDAVNAKWQEGVRNLLNKTAQLAPNKIIMANVRDNTFTPQLGGALNEHFTPDYLHGWKDQMNRYLTANFGRQPGVYVITSDTNNIQNQFLDMRKFRFSYASALLGDGYFAFSDGDQTHQARWWYDEYNFNLGKPLSALKNLDNSSQSPDRGVWIREFDNGEVFVNTTEQKQAIPLAVEMEKIKGTQDPQINDGAIVRKIYLAADEGIVLQKRIIELLDTPYFNGSFVKAYNQAFAPIGRNGFFLFDKKFLGDDLIARSDLDNDGQVETIASDKAKLVIYNQDLSTRKVIYPFGEKYNGGVLFAISSDSSGKNIYVSAAAGQPGLKVYDFSGNQLGETIYPFGKSFKKGIKVAVGKFDGVKFTIAAVSATGLPKIKYLDLNGKALSREISLGKLAAISSIAAGDLNGDGKDEVVVGQGVGSKGNVLILNQNGKVTGKRTGISASKTQGIRLLVGAVGGNDNEVILLATPNLF